MAGATCLTNSLHHAELGRHALPGTVAVQSRLAHAGPQGQGTVGAATSPPEFLQHVSQFPRQPGYPPSCRLSQPDLSPHVNGFTLSQCPTCAGSVATTVVNPASSSWTQAERFVDPATAVVTDRKLEAIQVVPPTPRERSAPLPASAAPYSAMAHPAAAELHP